MRKIQEGLTMLAVLLGSCGALVFSYTDYAYIVFEQNQWLIWGLLISAVASAFGAAVLSFLR
jgi:hypothetical protein